MVDACLGRGTISAKGKEAIRSWEEAPGRSTSTHILPYPAEEGLQMGRKPSISGDTDTEGGTRETMSLTMLSVHGNQSTRHSLVAVGYDKCQRVCGERTKVQLAQREKKKQSESKSNQH
jgi:hypothetical protein